MHSLRYVICSAVLASGLLLAGCNSGVKASGWSSNGINGASNSSSGSPGGGEGFGSGRGVNSTGAGASSGSGGVNGGSTAVGL